MRKILKEISAHSLVYLVGSIAISASGILLLPLYTRFLTEADYGVMEILDSMNSLLFIVFMAGLNAAYGKFHHESKTEQGQKEVFGTCFWSVFAFSTIWIGILAYGAEGLARIIFGREGLKNLLLVGLAGIWVNTLYILGTTYLNVNKLPGTFLAYALTKLCISIPINLVLIMHFNYGAMGMVLGDLISTLVCALVLFWFLIRRTGLPFSLVLWKQIIVFGLPYVPSLLCAAIMHRADRYLLQSLSSLEAVGIYGIGYKFPFMLGGLLTQSFGRIWGASTQFEVAKQPDAAHVFSRVTTYFMTVLIVAEFTVAITSTTILKLLATPIYFPAASVIQILAAGFCIYALHSFFQIGAVLKNKTWYLPISYFAAGVTTLALDLFLVPRFGYIGAAWGMVASYSVFSAILYFTINRFYPIPYEFGRMSVLFLLGVAIIIANNSITFQSFHYEILKQCAFSCILPIYILFGPYLRLDEVRSVNQFLVLKAPALSAAYSRIRRTSAMSSSRH